MFTQDSKRFLVSVSIALAVLLASAGQARAQFTFGEPENLGPVVNSSSRDQGPSVSADGLTLFFGSSRPGGLGELDLWVTTRASTADPWQSPVSLGPPVNTEYEEAAPSISTDGLTLYFNSNRPGSLGYNDLYTTRRASLSDPWQTPVQIGPPVSTAWNEFQPDISADGLTLFFGFWDGSGSDLWATTRANVSDPWQAPASLGVPVNSSFAEWGSSISTDGLTLFFNTLRPGGMGGDDLWMATRTSVSDPWQSAVNLGPLVNTVNADGNPEISADGMTLFFKSTRPGGSGGIDLGQGAVISRCPADLNGDGTVGPVDLATLLGNWGPCDDCPMDFNDDGLVGPFDLATLLGSWGPCPCNEC